MMAGGSQTDRRPISVKREASRTYPKKPTDLLFLTVLPIDHLADNSASDPKTSAQGERPYPNGRHKIIL